MKTRYQFNKMRVKAYNTVRERKKSDQEEENQKYPALFPYLFLVVLGRAWWFWNTPCTHNAAND
jgi:hypothetical protein